MSQLFDNRNGNYQRDLGDAVSGIKVKADMVLDEAAARLGLGADGMSLDANADHQSSMSGPAA